MVGRHLSQVGDTPLIGQVLLGYPSAIVGCYWAPGVEYAASRGSERAWHVSCQHYPLSLGLYNRIRDWHGRKQGLCVWVQRVLIQLVAVCNLGDLTKIHHNYTVAYVTHY